MPDLRAACEDHRTEAAAEPRGWLKDRFHQCFSKRINLIVIRDDNGAPAGEVTFELWLLGWANHGVRQVDYLASVENITVSTIPGNVIDWPNQLIELIPRGCTSTADVTCATGTARTVDGWFRIPAYGFVYTSPSGTGTGSDKTLYNRVTFDIRAGTLPIRPGTVFDVVETHMRFDSGRKIQRAHGAVFPDLAAQLTFRLSDRDVNESAAHIRDAQDYPIRTFPSWPNKTIPGKPGGEPLHRTVDDARRDANRAAAIKVCEDVWGTGYPIGGRQCDEYPFAATQEGAANVGANGAPTRRFSARPINGSDNGEAGNRLGVFYNDQRVIDAEMFYVKIIP